MPIFVRLLHGNLCRERGSSLKALIGLKVRCILEQVHGIVNLIFQGFAARFYDKREDSAAIPTKIQPIGNAVLGVQYSSQRKTRQMGLGGIVGAQGFGQ